MANIISIPIHMVLELHHDDFAGDLLPKLFRSLQANNVLLGMNTWESEAGGNPEFVFTGTPDDIRAVIMDALDGDIGYLDVLEMYS